MNVRYRAELSQVERDGLWRLLAAASMSRKLKRARLCWLPMRGAGDVEIAKNVGVGGSTVYRIRGPFVERNLELALNEDVPRGGPHAHGQGGSLAVGSCLWAPPKGVPAGRSICPQVHSSSSPKKKGRRTRKSTRSGRE